MINQFESLLKHKDIFWSLAWIAKTAGYVNLIVNTSDTSLLNKIYPLINKYAIKFIFED
jgi:hypothetical protein